MIISRAEIDSVVSAYRVRRKVRVYTGSILGTDAYEPSEAANLSGLREEVLAEPFFREPVVLELRRRIAEGRYFVPAEEIVEKMLGRLVVEAAVSN